jgi:hypothetical protein
MSNFKLAFVELYLPMKHGILTKKNSSMYGNYLIVDSLHVEEFYKNVSGLNVDTAELREMFAEYLEKLKDEMNHSRIHPIIQNYEKIMTHPKQFQLQLIEPVTISTGPNEWDRYSTAIIKTHWLCLIQRRWREIMKKRVEVKKSLKNLQYKEVHGVWPSECNIKFKLGL